MNTIKPSFLIGSSSNLQLMRKGIKSWTSLILGQIGLFALELLALEWWKLFPLTYIGENVVNIIIAPLFFIGSSSHLQITRTGIKSWMSSNSGQIQPVTLELLALEVLKKNVVYTIVSLILVGSLPNLQVTRTGIKSQMSLISSQVQLFASELLILESNFFPP